MQEDIKNVPVENANETNLTEYMKTCVELSVNMTLQPGELRDRCFHLIGGGAVFGICIGELPDSFLVSSSCQLVSDAGKIDGKPFSRAKIIRLIRSAVAFISIPDAEYRYLYYRWLKKQFTDQSDFFDQERRDIIEKFVYAYENRDAKKAEQSENDGTGLDQESKKEGFGESDRSFWSIYRTNSFH